MSSLPRLTGSSGEEQSGGGLLLPDSAEYLAALEARLQRLKARQETRAKAARSVRRSADLTARITTSNDLNGDDSRGRPHSAAADEKRDSDVNDLIDAVHPSASAVASALPPPTTAASSTSHPSVQHRATIGLHSSPFTEEEAASIMASAAPINGGEVMSDTGEVVEDASRMVSSDNDAVGVVANKTALYEHMDDDKCCTM